MTRTPSLESLKDQQLKLSGRVVLKAAFASARDVKTVGGLDVNYRNNGTATAAAAILELPSLKVLRTVSLTARISKLFPYVPGLFSFRELPLLEKLIRKYSLAPDVFLVDGHGIAHPRRFGLASHLGVCLNRPTIGCAKDILVGSFDEPPPGLRGAYQFIRDEGGDIMGIALRTKPNVKPVFVSPGHLMDIEMAGDIVMACTAGFRVPEPLRLAHQAAMRVLNLKSQI